MAQRHSVKRHLNVDAAGYDEQIRRFIPHYDELLATGVDFLRALVAPRAEVMDLGAGTGGLSEAVLEGLPEARVTLLDVDAQMLAVARRRLERFGDRVSFSEGSFLDTLPAADAVVASLALHHIPDIGAKTEVYRAICAALSPGGAFLNLDAAIGGQLRLDALVYDRWAAHMATHGIEDAEARAHFAAWADEDTYFALDAELKAMRSAGFAEVECFWRRGPSAICCGLRADG